MANRVGQQLGNYRLIRLLGKGGFAEVYLGEHIHLNTFAAVKVMENKLTGQEVDEFRNEARTLASLVNPHIVRVFDFGLDRETPFLIMDYAPNGTLRQRHPRGTKLPLGTIVVYVKQIAEALQYAHDRQVIHRDIKPENMLLGRQDEVLLSDFGIATVAQSSQAQHTQSVVGTISYMAPEQIQGKPRPASDQYALGVLAYEWLSGDRPFSGSFVELTTQHMYAPPPPLSPKVPGMSPAVEQVVMQTLEKDHHQRYASVTRFANALEQCLLSSAGPARKPQAPRTQQVPVPPKPQAPVRVMAPPPTTAYSLSSTVPALPKPSTAHISWPTFSLSLDERRAISTGKLLQEPLVTTGQVLLTPPGPLPIVTTIPPVSTLPPSSFVQPGAGQPNYIRAQGGPPSMGGIIRSTVPFNTPQPVTPAGGQPVAQAPSSGPGGMVIARTIGGSSPVQKTPPVSSPTEVARLNVTSISLACLSLVELILAFVFVNIQEVVESEAGNYSTIASLAPVVIFITVILAFSFAIVAIRKNQAVKASAKLAGWSISLSVLVTLAEITRLATHVLIR